MHIESWELYPWKTESMKVDGRLEGCIYKDCTGTGVLRTLSVKCPSRKYEELSSHPHPLLHEARHGRRAPLVTLVPGARDGEIYRAVWLANLLNS